MVARGRYARVSNVDSERLIKAFEGNDTDCPEPADTLDMNGQ